MSNSCTAVVGGEGGDGHSPSDGNGPPSDCDVVSVMVTAPPKTEKSFNRPSAWSCASGIPDQSKVSGESPLVSTQLPPVMGTSPPLLSRTCCSSGSTSTVTSLT